MEAVDPASHGVLSADERTEFALASSLCAQTLHWPLAGSQQLWSRLQSAPALVEGKKPKQDGFAQAVAEFEVPSASNVGMKDLLSLRANEASFADFREAYGLAVFEAAELARRGGGGDAAVTLLRDRLEGHRDRCVAAVRRISALDGLLMPTGAMLGAAYVNYSLGVLPSTPADFIKLGVELAAPGALWLAVRLSQALMAGVSNDHAVAVYGALIERAAY
ncbi:hypothetical protein [Rhizobium leguminosarum]|nr:hypothetical protein [Rhizobium leguminosarum]NKK29633.1 hypothetical protein [Rhizobium leguminosarum bv. viciae]